MRRWWVAAAIAASLGVCLPVEADVHGLPNPSGPLAGRTIVFSPGHGIFLDNGRWRFQRGIVHGLREDIHTNEIFIEYVQRYLANAGARVESCRERSFQRHEVIVDNGGAGYSETGSWSSSTSAPNFYGSGYRYARVAGSAATAAATFRPTIPAAGRYPVYAWWTPSSNRASDATFVVHHTGGATAVTVNMQERGDHWRYLGEFHFAAGTSGKVVLSNAGATTTQNVIADAVRFGGGVGASGLVRWREAAKEFLAHKGFQSTRSDVTIRPSYATWLAGGDVQRWRSDFLYVALHSNASGGSGTARGLSTFSYSNGRPPSWGSAGSVTYPTAPSPLTDASDALRDALHRELLSAIRTGFEPSWADRRVHEMNFGELRESRMMPSALIELGFHDNAEDVALLSSSRFRAVAGRAIYKGIVKYWAPGSAIIPLPPRAVRVENLGGGQVRVGWSAVLDPLEASAAASGFVVYTSRDGRGFDNGRTTNATSLTLTGLTAGDPIFVRVAATNAGGESLPTRVCGGRVGDPARRLLLVDGFHRAFEHSESNIAARFTYGYSVEHVAALSAAAPSAAVDYASNEAVIAGDVRLGDYPFVDWLLARESSVDRTFDPDEQRLVEAYLTAGGALLASGTEIGWDLKARGGGPQFLEDVLGARYLRDDAGASTARVAPQSPFSSALPTLSLSDGSESYAAVYPDVLEPAANGVIAVSYEAAGAPSAGVARRSPTKVVVLGFPLEAVTDGAARAQLTREAIAYLVPQGFGGGSTPPTGGGSAPPPTGSSPPPTGGSTPPTGGSPPPTGGSTPPTGSTAPGSTASPPATGGGSGSGGGGCSLVPADSGGAPTGALWSLLLLGLVALRRPRNQQPA